MHRMPPHQPRIIWLQMSIVDRAVHYWNTQEQWWRTLEGCWVYLGCRETVNT